MIYSTSLDEDKFVHVRTQEKRTIVCFDYDCKQMTIVRAFSFFKECTFFLYKQILEDYLRLLDRI